MQHNIKLLENVQLVKFKIVIKHYKKKRNGKI